METRDDSNEPQVPVFGGVLLTGMSLAGLFGLIFALAAGRSWLSGIRYDAALAAIHQNLVTLTMAQLCGMGGALFVGLRLFAPEASLAEAVAARPVRARVLALCFLAGLCLQFPLTELSNLLHEVLGQDSMEQQLAMQNLLSPRNLAQGSVVVVCLAGLVPATEELLFRGFLLFGFSRRHPAVAALIASSVLFGLSHVAPVNALYATVGGLILGSVALWTRSVFPGIALHAAVNAVPVLLPEHVLPIRGFNVPSPTPEHLAPWLAVGPLVVGLGLLAWVRRIEYLPER